MAILQVNVRPAPKVGWNEKTQRRVQSQELAFNTDNNTDNNTEHISEELANRRPSPPDLAFESSSGSIETMFDASSSIETNALATEVTPIPIKKDSKSRPESISVLSRVDKLSANAGPLEEALLDFPASESQTLADEPDQAWQKIVWQLMPETPVGRALVSATQRLESSDIDTASLDAQVILARILGRDRAWLFAHHEYPLSKEEAARFTDRIVRRMAHEPVAYLIGCKEFYGLEFSVDQRVLIPRPETELLVDAVLSHLEMRADGMPLGHQLRIADVGTGCGAIAVSVACNAPDVKVYATDISPDALEIARTNIRRLDQRCQVSLLEGDLLEPLQNRVDIAKVDIIVANLPYINSADYDGLGPDVRNFEPQLALEAGPQGLDTIARLLQQAPTNLNPNGAILLEIGYDQGQLVLDLVNQYIPDARIVNLRQDYNGKDRLITVVL